MEKSNNITITIVPDVEEVSIIINKITKKSKLMISGKEVEISHKDVMQLIDLVYCQINDPPLKIHSAISFESEKNILTCMCQDCDIEIDIDLNSKDWEKKRDEFFKDHPIVAKG